MSSIRKTDTRPELAMRRALWRAGLRGWRCYGKLPGTPDIVFPRAMVAIHVDGVWWHGHPSFFRPRRLSAYWRQKIRGNVARDIRVDRQLRDLGWLSVRFWDIEVLDDPESCAGRVRDLVAQRLRLPVTGTARVGLRLSANKRIAESLR